MKIIRACFDKKVFGAKRFLFSLAAIMTFCFSANAEARNALLIANNSYQKFSSLSTPIKEARDLKYALEKIGFAVTVVENASHERMNDSLYEFQKKLERVGGIGFFHYGGHAVQVNGKNYLIPVDADIPDERRVSTRAVDVDELMESMQAETNIVILDACRNNPLPAASGRSASRGLVVVDKRPANSIIVYSAQAGKVAQDGVFTPVLTKKLLEKKSFTEILIDVRREVRESTSNNQSPCDYSELESAIFLAGYSDGGQNNSPTPPKSKEKSAEEYFSLGVDAYNAKDYGAAVEYYQKAANMGHASAQNNMGHCYYNGYGVPQNYSKAAEYFRMAAEQGEINGQKNYGMMLENGYGVSKDLSEALRWYKAAAAQGNEKAKECVRRLSGSVNQYASSGQWIFPVYGLTLGQSTEAQKTTKWVKSNDRSYYVNEHLFEFGKNGILRWVQFFDPKEWPWPQEILNKGYNPNYSYYQWKSFLVSQGYAITKYSEYPKKINAEKNIPIKHELDVGFTNDGKISHLRINTN